MTAVAGTRLIESREEAEAAITAYRERHVILAMADDRGHVCKHDGIRVFPNADRLSWRHDMDEVRDLDRLSR